MIPRPRQTAKARARSRAKWERREQRRRELADLKLAIETAVTMGGMKHLPECIMLMVDPSQGLGPVYQCFPGCPVREVRKLERLLVARGRRQVLSTRS